MVVYDLVVKYSSSSITNVLSGLVRIRRSFFLTRFGELQMGIFLRQKFYERGIEILIN